MTQIAEQGHAVVPSVLVPAEIESLRIAIDVLPDDPRVLRRDGAVYGIRDLLSVLPAARAWAESASLRKYIEPILPHARLVRGLFFDKSPAANWKVVWHQDVTIEVSRRVDTDGYTAWSEKEGIVHVQPPVAVLEKMISLRVHLDDADAEGGALKVLPGSHTQGRLSSAQTAEWRGREGAEVCVVRAGDIHILRPLLLHASSPLERIQRRRVLHFDYCNADLPAPMAWRAEK